METKEHFDNRVNEIMRDKEKAEKIVKNYWNALVEIDTLTRKVVKLERELRNK